MEKPPVLSDDWDNNLYRNVVHVLAECENMIPGGQAERVIEVCDALYGERIKQARQDTAREILAWVDEYPVSYYSEIVFKAKLLAFVKSKFLIPPNPVGAGDV